MKPASEFPIVIVGVLFSTFLVLLASGPGGRARAGAFLAGWILPGAGHLVLGRWKKGLFFFSLLSATYGFGMWIVDFRAVSFDDNPFYYLGQYGCGGMMLLAKVLDRAYIPEDLHPSLFDPGLLYVCVAGLLNIVVMLNVIDLERPDGKPSAPPVEKEPVPEPAPVTEDPR